jgi:opacity protein-like surface antigen
MKTKPLKTAAFIAALAALPLFTPPAQAENSVVFDNLNPYIGIDLQRTDYDYNSNYRNDTLPAGAFLDGNIVLEDALDGFNIHAGIRPHKYFGAELGYFRTKEEGKSISAGANVGPNNTVATADFSTDVRVHGLTLDALGYLPLGEQERFELIGTAGLSWSKGELSGTDGTTTLDVDESEIGFRAGAGAQFNITDRVNVRGLARYQTADFDDVADNAWTYAVGLNFSF